MFTYEKYRDVRREYFGETNKQIRKGYKRYKMAKQGTDINNNMVHYTTFSLAPLPKAVPAPVWNELDEYCKYKEGKTPMRNYNDSYACASVQTAKSDTAVTRDYLLNRLENAQWPKEREFQNTFNLFIDNTPKTYKELIDVIKNGKYTIDPKIEAKLVVAEDDEENWYCGPLYGIIWDGPKTDRPGYDQALKDLKVQQVKARDQIMVGDAAAGLAALEAFEAWQPTAATTTVN